ncbi:MAG TPA: hypothetical protein VED37_17890 [Ktedonobacteraceae bacterium]|nr:hypothetical protein [Ktedonobacteraceae bacterium]
MRTYKMTLDLMVINPVLFAQGYRLGKDPLNMAVETTRSAFLSYIAQMKHDDLKGWIPEDQFHKRLAMESGMKVTINNPIIQADPKRVKPLATELETDINDLDDIRGEIQKLKDELRKMQEEQEKTYIAGITMNRMKERDTEFERKQEIDRLNHESSKRKLERKNEEAEQIHKLNHQLLETAAQEMAQILQAHIRDTFDSKKSITDIVEDLDEFMKALHGTLLKVTIDDTIDSNNSGAKTNGKSP